MPNLDAEPSSPGRRRSRRSITVSVAGVLVAAAALAAGWVGWPRAADGADDPGADWVEVRTVEVARTDLSRERTLPGSLGFGPSRPVSGGRDGIVTWLPEPGTVLRRGEVLFRVDDEAVPLFVGSPPLYRALSEPNTVGRDVAMVARNLEKLGYAVGYQPGPGEWVEQVTPADADPDPNADPDPDANSDPDGSDPSGDGSPTTTSTWVEVREGEGVLTPALIEAIRAWQRDLGRRDDGRLQVGDVVVLPHRVRVAAVTALVGDGAATDLLDVTRTAKVVTVAIPAAGEDSFVEGDPVSVRLPDGTVTPGEISTIATVAEQPEGHSGGGIGQQTLTVTVTLDEPDAAGSLDGGEVEVLVPGETRTGVLAVPVNALLALREGGYAVQLEDGSLLAVETGLFDQGLVEVSGDAVREGLRVVTTS